MDSHKAMIERRAERANEAQSVLLLVQRLCALTSESGATSVASLDALRDGRVYYSVLHRIAPHAFAAMGVVADADTSDAEARRWLVADMNAYTRAVLNPPASFDLTQLVPETGQDDVLAELFVVLVVLSGVEEVMRVVRGLPREDQLVLSSMAKRTLARYGLRPVRRPDPPPASPITTRAESPREPAVVEESYYRNATAQLRRELAEASARIAALEAAHELAQEEKQSWEARYRQLLAEQTAQTSNGVEDDAARARLAQKEAVIRALTARAEEQSGTLSEFREAMTMQEAALECVRRKLRHAEEDVVRRAAAQRETAAKLAVAEDKLAIQHTARVELEAELEALQSQLTLLRVHQLDGAAGTREPNVAPLQASFASNTSVDRVVQLENDLERVRGERDAVQRQLEVVQRQIAALPEPVVDSTAAIDTWRAQLRQVEQERDDLHQQLLTALERLEQIQHTASTSQDSAQRDRRVDDDDAERRVRLVREDALRYQTLLSSMLLQYGYENLMLRQHEVLLHPGTQPEHGTATGSILTRQRRIVERGLLDSVIHSSRVC